MFEEFHRGSGTKIIRDSQQMVRDLRHERHVVSDATTVQLAAQDYLRKFRKLIGAKASEFDNLSLHPDHDPVDAGTEYRFVAEKPQFDTTTVSYAQTFFGLRVWEAGLAVHLKHAPFRILGMQLTRQPGVRAAKVSEQALARLKRLDARMLAKVLGIAGNRTEFHPGSLRLHHHHRLMIYRYQKSRRGSDRQSGGNDNSTSPLRTLSLPPVHGSVVEGRHYVVAAVDFRLDSRRFGILHWVALVEAETLSVLYLRALIDDACGLVFHADPMTAAGGPAVTASNRELNPLRSSMQLHGLKHADQAGLCALSGEIVEIRQFKRRKTTLPMRPMGMDFDYPVRSDDFAAVNAYYHCDRFFRLVEELGFPRSRYFKATRFPLPVEHRGRINTPDGIEINAHCQGHGSAHGGILGVRFALADDRRDLDPIGIACDWRVVLHELGGHGTLWNHVHKGRFNFAHSAGDSLAAILSDPDTQATGDDRFDTFPWLPALDRRHDRKVSEGWAWGGTKDLGVNLQRKEDPTGYQSEQILSTTHFRIYRAIGGDSDGPSMRRFAARFAAYLILRAIGSLTPAHSPDHVAGYAAALLWADAGDWTSEGHPGGAYGKVIRWAFEKQGLYQPAGAGMPVTTEGAPPPVDVYIEDGRNGEYEFQPRYWICEAIWNRHAADDGTKHQEPVAGATNFAYVKIKNRGTTVATKVTVRAFHCRASVGLIYPDDWQPMTTAALPARNVAANSASEITVGPFEWQPAQAGDVGMLMVVSAPGDASNVDQFTSGESIPDWRLVPHDNNIGKRNVFLIDATDPQGLLAGFGNRCVHVKNPHAKRARMVIRPVLPQFLADGGWQIEFTSPGGGAFSLEPLAGRDLTMRLKPGRAFTARDISRTPHPVIHLDVYADEIPIGGMCYRLKPSKKVRSRRRRAQRRPTRRA